MCIILLAESKQLTKAILEKAETTNPHGAGIAWINDKTKTKNVKWIKGINLDSEGILKLIKIRKIKTPYIVHFRISSVGSISDQLCHPFDLNALLSENKQSGKTEAGVLFHNGTMIDYETHYDLVFEAGKTLTKNDNGIFNDIELELSDSRVMSYIANKNRLGLGYLEKLIGQKIAVLTKEGIKTYGAGWENIEEIKMSNDHGMKYNSCENNFYGYGNFNETGYSVCYPEIEEKTTKKKFETKQMIKQTEKRIKELENKLKSKKKIAKKELKKINKALKKSKKRLNKELRKEIAKAKKELAEIELQDKLYALNKKQEKITSYNGHGKNCNCIKCYKSRDLQVDSNREFMEKQVKIEKSQTTKNFEAKEIDYLNDCLDSEYILEQIDYLGILTDQETELIYNYLKTLTYESFDNIYARCLDKEILKSELIELAKTYEFSKGWKNELINGVKKW